MTDLPIPRISLRRLPAKDNFKFHDLVWAAIVTVFGHSHAYLAGPRSARSSSTRAPSRAQRPDSVAGVRGLELRYPAASRKDGLALSSLPIKLVRTPA